MPSGPRFSPSPQRRLGRDPSGPVDPTIPALCCPTLCLPAAPQGRAVMATQPGWCWGSLSQPLHPHARLGLHRTGQGCLSFPLRPLHRESLQTLFLNQKKKKNPSSRMQSQLLSKRNNTGILHETFSISGEKGPHSRQQLLQPHRMSYLCLDAGHQSQ